MCNLWHISWTLWRWSVFGRIRRYFAEDKRHNCICFYLSDLFKSIILFLFSWCCQFNTKRNLQGMASGRYGVCREVLWVELLGLQFIHLLQGGLKPKTPLLVKLLTSDSLTDTTRFVAAEHKSQDLMQLASTNSNDRIKSTSNSGLNSPEKNSWK